MNRFDVRMVERYSGLQARLHDSLIAGRALKLHEQILAETGLLRILAQERERHLLDVGCGGGQAAIRLRERFPHLTVTGIDLSEVMIRSARRRARRARSTARFAVADAQALPFADANFDAVYSFGSAKHWPEPPRGFEECWRVLGPGGELLVADATSDATLDQVENFIDVLGLPAVLKRRLARLLHRRLFQPARPVEAYRRIARDAGMPEGTVSHLPSLPVFLFRARKPFH